MLQHFSQYRVRRQIDEPTSNVCHDQPEPKRRNLRKEKIANDAANERGRFDRGDPCQRRSKGCQVRGLRELCGCREPKTTTILSRLSLEFPLEFPKPNRPSYCESLMRQLAQ